MKTKKRVTKAAFIRRHPSVSAPDLVRLAKEHGVHTTAEYVHSVRSAQKGKPKAARGAVEQPTEPKFTLEELLQAVAAELGLGQAIRLLEAKRHAVARVLAGASR